MSIRNVRTREHRQRKSVVTIATLLILLSSAPQSWAVPLPCLPWANYTDTYNPVPENGYGDAFWFAFACPNCQVSIFARGVFDSNIPVSGSIGYTAHQPALQYFDNRMVILIKGLDGKVYANSWRPPSVPSDPWYAGWGSFPIPTNFTQHSPSLASTIPQSPTPQNPGALLAVAKTTDGLVWGALSLTLANGFSGYPEGWRRLGGPTQVASGNVACGNPSELRMGGQGADGSCHRRRSTNYGSTWTGDEVLDPCP